MLELFHSDILSRLGIQVESQPLQNTRGSIPWGEHSGGPKDGTSMTTCQVARSILCLRVGNPGRWMRKSRKCSLLSRTGDDSPNWSIFGAKFVGHHVDPPGSAAQGKTKKPSSNIREFGHCFAGLSFPRLRANNKIVWTRRCSSQITTRCHRSEVLRYSSRASHTALI